MTSPVLVRLGFRPWPWPLVLIIFSYGITWTLGTRAWQSSKNTMLDGDLEEEEEGKWPDDCLSEHDQASCCGGQEEQLVEHSPSETSLLHSLGTFPGSDMPTLTSHHGSGS